MGVTSIEWVAGDPFWPRVYGLVRWVTIGVAVVALLTVFQDLGLLRVLPYSTLGLTGSLVQLGWIGVLLFTTFLPFRLPVAGPIGITPAGLVVRGTLKSRVIPRGRIVWVSARRAVIRGWRGGEIVLTPIQGDRIARWFYNP